MKVLIISIICFSVSLNIIADLYLVSGREKNKGNYVKEEVFKNTPDKHLFLSAKLGLIAISFWLCPNYYLAQIPGMLGFILTLSYSIHIATIMVFHVVCAYFIYLLKHETEKSGTHELHFKFFTFASASTSLIFTILMVYASFTNAVQMSIIQVLALPFFSVGIISYIIAKIILKKLRHLQYISGSLAMLVSMISIVTIFA